jgi:hypothetical protein
VKWITNPDVLADALANLLEAVDPAGEDTARWQSYTDTERADLLEGQAGGLVRPLVAKAAARAALAAHKAGDPDVVTVPVMDKYGCSDGDLDDLLGYVDGMFAALAALRSGELILDGTREIDTLDRLRAGLTAVGCHLAPRVQGLLDALTNAHYAAGGSPAELARALNIAYGTVAKRSIRRKGASPGAWEKWALGESDPGEYLATEIRPGWILLDKGMRRQAQSVSVYGDGLVDVNVGTDQVCFAPGAGVVAIPHPAPFVSTSGQLTSAPDGQPLTESIAVTTYTRPRRTPVAS